MGGFLILSAKGRVARRDGINNPGEVLCEHQNLFARTSNAQFAQQQICAQVRNEPSENFKNRPNGRFFDF